MQMLRNIYSENSENWLYNYMPYRNLTLQKLLKLAPDQIERLWSGMYCMLKYFRQGGER